MQVISRWHKEGGVLLIGYELYRQLSLKKPPKSRTRGRKRTENEEDVADEKSKNLLERRLRDVSIANAGATVSPSMITFYNRNSSYVQRFSETGTRFSDL